MLPSETAWFRQDEKKIPENSSSREKVEQDRGKGSRWAAGPRDRTHGGEKIRIGILHRTLEKSLCFSGPQFLCLPPLPGGGMQGSKRGSNRKCTV